MGLFPCSPADGQAAVFSVAEVTGIIRGALDIPALAGCWVRGEVTGCKRSAAGHFFFSLSETRGGKSAVIPAVMFRGSAAALSFDPADGMDVLAFGTVDFYEAQGKCQIYVEDLRRAGEGEKHLLVERWKKELAAEGLFDPGRKKDVPPFPRRVAVVTSSTGAVLHDIENVLARRYPVEILLSPTAVQGDLAHIEIAAAIRRADDRADVMIVGRGGGSFEDLFPFNRPEVVRAIAACTTPVISAVGHEVDTTLADLAADLRAPTPSAAAELAVPDRTELLAGLARDRTRLSDSILRQVERRSEELEHLRLRLRPERYRRRIAEQRQGLSDLEERIVRGCVQGVERRGLALSGMKVRLRASDPHAPLERGYALATKGGAVIRSVRDLSPGDQIALRVADGGCHLIVEDVYDAEDL
ncbi:MAG: exodeoxyribonuclease large subunit [Methanofollis sp.]|nr:exodeoxyribonuclease large subunit [Methanofollis sp.]